MYDPLHHCRHLHLFVIIVDKIHFRFLFSSALLQFVLDLCVCVCVCFFVSLACPCTRKDPTTSIQAKEKWWTLKVSFQKFGWMAMMFFYVLAIIHWMLCASLSLLLLEKNTFKCIFIIGSKLFKAHEPYIYGAVSVSCIMSYVSPLFQ